MLFRAVCSPIFVGLSTAAIFAAGASPALADTTPTATPTSPAKSPAKTPTKTPAKTPTAKPTKATPTKTKTATATPPKEEDPTTPPKTPTNTPSIPSNDPTPDPKPVVYLQLTAPGGKIYPGDSVTAQAFIHGSSAKTPAKGTKLAFSATSKATVTPACTKKSGSTCTIGDLYLKGRSIAATVKIPSNLKPGTVTLTAKLSASNATARSGTAKLTVSKKPTTSPSPSSSGGGGGSGGGSGGGGVAPTYPQVTPNGSLNPASPVPSPSVALPPLNQGQVPNPSVAPSPIAAGPTSTLRSNDTPVAQEMTFERVASTQAAWLAALLVAFSLLLTHLRLSRKPATAAAAATNKGNHRRPRRGAFSR